MCISCRSYIGTSFLVLPIFASVFLISCRDDADPDPLIEYAEYIQKIEGQYDNVSVVTLQENNRLSIQYEDELYEFEITEATASLTPANDAFHLNVYVIPTGDNYTYDPVDEKGCKIPNCALYFYIYPNSYNMIWYVIPLRKIGGSSFVLRDEKPYDK